MLASGWYVGAGKGTGPKSETTVAFTPSAAAGLAPGILLGASWLARWERSDAKQPLGDSSAEALEVIRKHPQFILETEAQ